VLGFDRFWLFDDHGGKRILDLFCAWRIWKLLQNEGTRVKALLFAASIFRIFPCRTTLVQFLFRLVRFGPKVAMYLPPTVSGDLIAKTLRKLGSKNKRHEMLEIIVKELGPIFSILRPISNEMRLLVPDVCISDPDMVKAVLLDKETFPSRGHTVLSNISVAKGLLALPTGPIWKKHRVIVGKYLSDKFLRSYAPKIAEKTDVMMYKWKEASGKGVSINAQFDVSALTLDIIMALSQGFETANSNTQLLKEEENLDFVESVPLLRYLMTEMTFPPLMYFRPTFVKNATARADNMFREVFQDAREMKVEDAIITSLMNELNDEEEAFAEFLTIRGAGHETTSNTVVMLIKLLIDHPEALAKLHEELDSQVEGKIPTYDEAKNLKYLQACIFETLRLRGTVPIFSRQAEKDFHLETELGEFWIPKGALVLVNAIAMNHSEDIWHDPLSFKPERFDPVPVLIPHQPVGIAGEKSSSDYAFAPFGAGNRTCIGSRLSMVEGAIIAAAIFKNFDLSLDPSKPEPELTSDITVGYKDGICLLPRERIFFETN